MARHPLVDIQLQELLTIHTAQALRDWQADIGLSSAERDELVRLRRQLKQVQMERDILAKATAWFAGKSEKASTTSTDS